VEFRRQARHAQTLLAMRVARPPRRGRRWACEPRPSRTSQGARPPATPNRPPRRSCTDWLPALSADCWDSAVPVGTWSVTSTILDAPARACTISAMSPEVSGPFVPRATTTTAPSSPSALRLSASCTPWYHWSPTARVDLGPFDVLFQVWLCVYCHRVAEDGDAAGHEPPGGRTERRECCRRGRRPRRGHRPCGCRRHMVRLLRHCRATRRGARRRSVDAGRAVVLVAPVGVGLAAVVPQPARAMAMAGPSRLPNGREREGATATTSFGAMLRPPPGGRRQVQALRRSGVGGSGVGGSGVGGSGVGGSGVGGSGVGGSGIEVLCATAPAEPDKELPEPIPADSPERIPGHDPNEFERPGPPAPLDCARACSGGRARAHSCRRARACSRGGARGQLCGRSPTRCRPTCPSLASPAPEPQARPSKRAALPPRRGHAQARRVGGAREG